MKLSSQQRTFFETFGYLGFPGLFADEADAITAEFERLWAEHGGGHHGQAHDYQQRSALVPFIDQSEYLSALLDDPRIDDVASDLVGDDYNYAGSDGNFYVGNSRWHSDGYARSAYRNIKFAFYLDPWARFRMPAGHPRQPPSRRRLCRVAPGHYVKPTGLDDG